MTQVLNEIITSEKVCSIKEQVLLHACTLSNRELQTKVAELLDKIKPRKGSLEKSIHIEKLECLKIMATEYAHIRRRRSGVYDFSIESKEEG